jgi:hypothetical protein
MHVPRTHLQLEKALRDQYGLLVKLGDIFDQGHTEMALPLSTSLRILLHDTQRSTSLLQQLGVKDTLRFRDTAIHIDPTATVWLSGGLVTARATTGIGAQWIVPGLDNLSPVRIHPDLAFDAWWTMPVVKDQRDQTWSRKDLVLGVANREGGAHIDPQQVQSFRELEEENALGGVCKVDTHQIAMYLRRESDPLMGEDQPFLNGPTLPCIRQIGHEVQATLEAHLPHLLALPE